MAPEIPPSVSSVNTEADIFKGPSDTKLWEINTGELLNREAQLHGSNQAVFSQWQNISWTYKTLRDESRDLAQKLINDGLLPGDRVVVLAGNCVEYLQLFFAVTAIGAVLVVINATFSLDEVINAVRFIGPRFVFIARQIGYRNYDQLLLTLNGTHHSQSEIRDNFRLLFIANDNEKIPGIQSFKDFATGNHSNSLEEFWAKIKSEVTCCIQFTSGTTGRRKATMLSHSNLINNGRLIGDRLDFTEDDRLCCPPPLSHCFGLVAGLLAAVTHGSCLVLPSEVFDPSQVLQAVLEKRCTAIHAVPTMFESLLRIQKTSKLAGSFHLKTGIIAGATLSGQLLQRLNEKLGLSGLHYAFGMTELSAISFMTTSDQSLLVDHSHVGQLMPHTLAKAIDDENNPLPPGREGELCVSGYLVHQGYYLDPEKTAEATHRDSQGRVWFHTGDLVTLNESGLCTVRGRIKDLIKKGGENIIPKDIEDNLLSHPQIAQAAVVGIPDEKWGEIVGAFCELASPQDVLSEKEIKVWLRKQGTAPHKMPDHYFVAGQGNGLPDTIPINSSGKIMKAELRTIAQQILLRNTT
ncbi:hypothetical protein ACMFMF_003717 [Clarireedia jacksonii]